MKKAHNFDIIDFSRLYLWSAIYLVSVHSANLLLFKRTSMHEKDRHTLTTEDFIYLHTAIDYLLHTRMVS